MACINKKRNAITDPEALQIKADQRRKCRVIVEFGNPGLPVVDIARAIKAGMNIVKFRMASTTKAQKIECMSKVDKALVLSAEKAGHPHVFCSTCMAIKTFIKKTGIIDPRYEVSNREPTPLVKKGTEVILTCDTSQIELCSPDKIYVNYDNLASDVKVGMEISVGTNGVIKMTCTKIIDDLSILCKVWQEGYLENLMTVHIRNMKHTIPYVSKIDINFLQFCVQYQVDILIVFYAQGSEMIQKVKRYISKAKVKPRIFAGISDQAGLDNLDDIIKVCDGIVFSRDYLTLELDNSMEFRISTLQKWVAAKCNQAGKPVFLSGAFEHVITHGTFTDADTLDASNAVLDGISGFILRECFDIENTLVAIKGLNEICCQTEPLIYDKNAFWRMMKEIKLPVNAAEAAAISCVAVSHEVNARAIINTTTSGRSARLLLWLQPPCLVITICSSARIAKSLASCRNVVPVISSTTQHKHGHSREDNRILQGAKFAVSQKWMGYGDMYVSLQRSADDVVYCDMVKVLIVDFVQKRLVECVDEYDRDSPDAEKKP